MDGKKPVSVYIHVPFCDGKCPYCDFYSIKPNEEMMERYCKRLVQSMQEYKGSGLTAKTVYFGGGTPNLLGADRLARLLDQVAQVFPLCADATGNAEITAELNPGHVGKGFFQTLKAGGFNRLSMGLQSANEEELSLLGRRHSAGDVKNAVLSAQEAGFNNISLDLMLGLPGAGKGKLLESIAYIASLNVQHVSAYMLKIEEGTPFAARYSETDLPEEDETADLYTFCIDELEKCGYLQYEISNFALPGWESRHNLIYWRCEEYLGFGPAAHSFYQGRRFYFTPSIQDFLAGTAPVEDGAGGGFEEYAMLALRLSRGLRREDCISRFENGERLFERVYQNSKKCPPEYIQADNDYVALTKKGFAVSNALILVLL